MITMIQPLPIGNALRVFLKPPAGMVRWRVLHKDSATFGDQNDASALIAYEGDEKIFVDTVALANDVMAFYRPYYTADGVLWTPGAVANATPTATYTDYTTDVMETLRVRLEAGLLVECQRGNFQPKNGYIQVYTAPPSLERDLLFPLVTIHLEDESSGERGIGENISADVFDSVGFAWVESEGWLAQVEIKFVAWSLNSDERIELRKALRRIIIANMAVFSSFGFEQIDFKQSDVDAVNGEYGAPVFQVMNEFSCLAPVRVGAAVSATNSVANVSIV